MHSVGRRLSLVLAVAAAARPGVVVERLGASAAAPTEARADSLAGRPVIILVHGRGQLARDTALVRREWLRAARDGAGRVAGLPALRDDDVRLAWYADALDPLAPAACDRALTAAGPDASGLAELRALFAAAGIAITGALDMMDERASLEARALAGDLLFLGDPRRRCAAEQRLDNALVRAAHEKRPVVLVAHSFGSLLAYGYLHSRSPNGGTPPVSELVTLGSLLGAPAARLLLLGDTSARPIAPPGVHGWTNVIDPRDGLAYAIPERSASDTVGTATRNIMTAPGEPGDDPHDVLRYLRDPATARALAEAWCRAYPRWAARPPPADCERARSERGRDRPRTGRPA
jgi:hypothetical protein